MLIIIMWLFMAATFGCCAAAISTREEAATKVYLAFGAVCFVSSIVCWFLARGGS